MEKRRQGDIKYKRFSIQRVASKEIGGLICWSIHHWGSGFY